MSCMTEYIAIDDDNIIFTHKWLVEVLLALPGMVLVMVSVLLGVIGEVLVHVEGEGGIESG